MFFATRTASPASQLSPRHARPATVKATQQTELERVVRYSQSRLLELRNVVQRVGAGVAVAFVGRWLDEPIRISPSATFRLPGSDA